MAAKRVGRASPGRSDFARSGPARHSNESLVRWRSNKHTRTCVVITSMKRTSEVLVRVRDGANSGDLFVVPEAKLEHIS